MNEELNAIMGQLDQMPKSSSLDETPPHPPSHPQPPASDWRGMAAKFRSETDPEWWSRLAKLDMTHHSQVRTLANWAGYFCRRSLRNDRSAWTWIVISGPTGTGKSTVGRFCRRVFNDWILEAILSGEAAWGFDRKPRADMLNWSAFCQNAERGSGMDWRLDEIRDADVAILDDIGSEADRFKSGEAKSRLRDLLECLRNKWVMVSTNIPKEKWMDAFGARVSDRMASAKHISTDGIPSYRSKLK